MFFRITYLLTNLYSKPWSAWSTACLPSDAAPSSLSMARFRRTRWRACTGRRSCTPGRARGRQIGASGTDATH
uniref:Uncharacterized protein n=1 Tax=Arundo donax TaxID=35708 RepID=A0A0A9C6Z9_ARUDO